MTEVEFDFGAWDVESLRVSIFHPSGSAGSTPTGLWAMVTNSEPESIDSRPREGVVREIGGVGGNNLILSTQEGRVDWLVQPIMAPNQQADTAPVLKAAKDVLAHSPERSSMHIECHSTRTAIGLQSLTDKTSSQSGSGARTDIEVPSTLGLRFDGRFRFHVPGQ